MKLYENPYKQMRKNYETIKQNYYRLRDELSRVDKQISALYHDLEKTDLSEEMGYQYAVALQNMLRKRRIIKDELISLEILRNTFRSSFEQANKRLSGNRTKSEEIRKSLNVCIKIDEVVKI
ncbi:hypothetical protein SPD48_14495 [Pseudogracilibacillus sp. SE30717A]|uniref:hypothetical protein n=1 Tax=Pseudogracilibacillus sp. SE30717A TaxID=3098293 RepID=UPI00300E681B